MNGNAQFLR